eukprot:4840647-Pyramimonas_sp.AAC.1
MDHRVGLELTSVRPEHFSRESKMRYAYGLQQNPYCSLSQHEVTINIQSVMLPPTQKTAGGCYCHEPALLGSWAAITKQ